MTAGVIGRTDRLPPRVRAVPLNVRTTWRERFVRFVFYLFIASMPFESIDIPALGAWSPTRVVGYALVAAGLLIPSRVFSWPGPAFWLFSAYVGIVATWIVFLPDEYGSIAFGRFMQVSQMVVLFWIGVNVMRGPGVARRAIWYFGLAVALLALLQVFDVSGRVVENRVTALNETANTTGNLFGLGLVSLLGLVYGGPRRPKFLVVLLVLALVTLIGMSQVATGSRGALLATTVGLLVLVMRRGSWWTKLRIVALGALALVFMAWLVSVNEPLRKRWMSTFERADLGYREKIFPEAAGMIMERPFFGWGTERHYFELGRRLGEVAKEEHNLVLWTFNETGLAGGLPYWTAIALCGLAAWRARRGRQGVLPLALFWMLMTLNMADVFQNRKTQWLLLAYMVASGAAVTSAQVVARPAHRLHRPRMGEAQGLASR